MKGTAVKIRERAQAEEKISAAAEVSRVAMYTAGLASALIGIWGLACFVGGLAASGGPVSLAGNLFSAVAGL
jgi:hypothetical protein